MGKNFAEPTRLSSVEFRQSCHTLCSTAARLGNRRQMRASSSARHLTDYEEQVGRPDRDDACGGFPRCSHQPTVPRGGHSPASLALNRQPRPVNARSAPVRATAPLTVGGNGGGDRSFLLLPKGAPSGGVGGGVVASSGPVDCNLYPGSLVPGGRGGRRVRPTVRQIHVQRQR